MFLSASAADLKMKFLLLVTLFGRFVAGARNLERGDGGGGKASPATWGVSETTSAQWYTPTLPPWTPSSSWPHSKSETCPAQTTLIVTKTITDTKTTTTTIGTPICGGGTTYMNYTTTYITSGCCDCSKPSVPTSCSTQSICTSQTCPACPTLCTSCSPGYTSTTTITTCCNASCPTAVCETILSGVVYRRSEAYGQLEVIASHTEYALPILILLILFGLLTLLALAWLIWKMSPRRKRGTCVTCGRPVRECICGT
jgi:hypothetical protein